MSESRIKKTRKMLEEAVMRRAREQSTAVLDLIYKSPWWMRAIWAYRVFVGRR